MVVSTHRVIPSEYFGQNLKARSRTKVAVGKLLAIKPGKGMTEEDKRIPKYSA